MTTILAGSPASFSVTVQHNGAPVALSGEVTARVSTLDGKTLLLNAQTASPSAAGADWSAGTVALTFTADQTKAFPVGDALLVVTGSFGVKRFRLVVEALFPQAVTSLFIKDLVVDEIRNDRLMAAAAGVLQDVRVSDDYLWDKVRAAESEIAHTLRVPLVPTRFFPDKPTPEQIAALDGLAWAVDAAYDYDPGMFVGETWGYIVTRHRPLISIERMGFAYPASNDSYVAIPNDWIRIDARYGHVRLVPSSPAVFMTMSAFVMNVMASARSVPFMIQLEYTAGLQDAARDYPELLDVIKKLAVLKVVGDAFLPKSGSISADGLSESMSVEMSDYQEMIEHTINGPADSNGGLMTKIHGVRALAM